MPVNIPVEILCLGISDIAALRKTHTFRVLSGHIDHDIGRNALAHIGQPFDGAGIDKGRHPHRFILIIDLRIQRTDLKLGHHIDQRAHLPVAQKRCGALVQQRDLRIVHLCDILCKGPLLNRQKLMILLRIDDGRRQKTSDPVDDKQDDRCGSSDLQRPDISGRDPVPDPSGTAEQRQHHYQ